MSTVRNGPPPARVAAWTRALLDAARAPTGRGVSVLLFAGAFAALYVLLSAFAQALESLSAIRRKALQDENPARFGRLLAPEHVNVSRIAVRLTAQGAVLGGLLSLGTMLAALGAPEPW